MRLLGFVGDVPIFDYDDYHDDYHDDYLDDYRTYVPPTPVPWYLWVLFVLPVLFFIACIVFASCRPFRYFIYHLLGADL